jgi:beta-N-acetylhexosaminidase
MEMRAVTKYYPNGEADLRAFYGRQWILIELSENLETAILKLIRKAIHQNTNMP